MKIENIVYLATAVATVSSIIRFTAITYNERSVEGRLDETGEKYLIKFEGRVESGTVTVTAELRRFRDTAGDFFSSLTNEAPGEIVLGKVLWEGPHLDFYTGAIDVLKFAAVVDEALGQ